jgi:hypothetical protein
MLKHDFSTLVCDDDRDGVWENCGDTEATYLTDVRDPSLYFITFEVGDNTVVTVEQGAVPMDMYYSRAFNFGDDYEQYDVCGDDYPGDASVCSDGETELRWDWLENKEPISEEASVTASPAGDRFYTIWNQELEIGTDLFTDMDAEFRRLFYNETDVALAPSASILYYSHRAGAYDRGDVLTYIGSARDRDRLGEGADITAYRWVSDKDGALGNGQTLVIPVTDLSLGFHTILFSARDNEGTWSVAQEIPLLVGESIYSAFLPKIGH